MQFYAKNIGDSRKCDERDWLLCISYHQIGSFRDEYVFMLYVHTDRCDEFIQMYAIGIPKIESTHIRDDILRAEE